MRFRTTLKTLIRSPLKSALTLLLLTATTFAFVSRGVEYVATVQQIRMAEKSYFATGTAERTTEAYYDYMSASVSGNAEYLDRQSKAILPLEQRVRKLVESSPYVLRSAVTQVSGGTSAELMNVIEQPLSALYDYSQWTWFWTENTFEMDSVFVIARREPDIEGATRRFVVEEVLIAADSSIIYSGENIQVFETHGHTSDKVLREKLFGDVLENDICLLALTTDHTNEKQAHKRIIDYIDCPVVNISQLERDYGMTDYIAALREPEKYGIPTVSSDEQPIISTLDCMKTLYLNLHTSEVVYTSDMDLIHKFKSGDMFIADGRALEENEDTEVCVIGADFAELNGLSVGDSITLDLCADTMIHSGKVFGRETPYPTDRDVVSENQLTERGLENVEKTFEIVGIWSDADFDVEDPYTYALNTIFVPESCYPWAGQVEASLLPSTFSFELKHPGDAVLIKAELGDRLAALGYELKIDDGGYAAAKPNLDFMRLSALIGFVAMCVGLLLCLVLITYLFIIRKKKDYAIMRALGTTKFRSNKALLSALLVLSLCSVAIGGTAGGVVAQETAVQVAAEVSDVTGVVAEVANSWTLVSAFAFGTVALVMLFGICGLVKIARAPPLALLQGR